MKKSSLTKYLREDMTEKEIEQYLRREAIAAELHVKQKAIYAKYNPEINRLKAEKMVELEALYDWRHALYVAEGLE